MFRKLDDLIINKFQWFVDKFEIKPNIAAYYSWGITLCLCIVLIVVYHEWTWCLFALSCLISQINVYKTPVIDNNIFRYDTSHFVGRCFVLIFTVSTLPINWVTGPKVILVMNIFWLIAVFVICCNKPPKKEKRVKEKKSDWVFQ